MFYESFNVSDTYSLVSKEYLHTSSSMPYVYTSLFSDEYFPVLSQETKDKLLGLLNFKNVFSTDATPPGMKMFTLDYVGDQIKGYDIRSKYQYNSLAFKTLHWHRFCNTCDIPEFIGLKDKIDIITDVSPSEHSYFCGIYYDENVQASSVIVTDTDWNFNPFHPMLKTVDEYRLEEGSLSRSFVSLGNTSTIKYLLDLNYPIHVHSVNGVLRPKIDYPSRRAWHIHRLQDRGLITADQAQFITDTVTGRSIFNIEFIVNDTDVVDIRLIHTRIKEFEDLTVD